MVETAPVGSGGDREIMTKMKMGAVGVQALTALGLLLASTSASAAIIVVDHVQCTLADAIQAANDDVAVGQCGAGSGADTIELPGDSMLVLNEALPTITSEVTILGNGSTIARAESAAGFSTLDVQYGDLTLEATIVSGGAGAGVQGFYSSLALRDCVVTGNSGGGVVNSWGYDTVLERTTVTGNTDAAAVQTLAGNLSVVQSSIVLNEASGLWLNYTNVVIEDSTIASNHDDGLVGGYAMVIIEDSTISSNGGVGVWGDSIDIAGSTVTGNADTGVFVFDNGFGLSIVNSIVSGNSGTEGREVQFIDVFGRQPQTSHNVFGHDGDAGLDGMAPSESDLVPVGTLASVLDPELRDNGGPTLTHLLRATSPARDAGGVCSAFDQRGVPRPQGVACDIGAVELALDPCGAAVASSGCMVNGVPNQRCVGGTGNDIIVGTPGPDVIVARAGDDAVWAAGGNDLVCGGDGADSLHGGSGADQLVGGPGADELWGDHGSDSLSGGGGVDACTLDASDVSDVTCE